MDDNQRYSTEPVGPLKTVMAGIRTRLAPKYGDGEAREMTRIIFENLKGWTPVDLAIRQDEPISGFIAAKADEAVARLLDDEPIQQIFGNANFYGMKFKVTPDTLIPRPETAELVDIIVKDNQGRDLKVLDAGTGSGCIAIALSRNLPFSDVTAIDVSDKALAVAAENARNLHTSIDFENVDILTLPGKLAGSHFDLIVSNPPYITESEKGAMDRNVLDFEPATALFVPDDDPLKFYTPILKAAAGDLLNPGGKIYFEINPHYAPSIAKEAAALGFNEVNIVRDTDGKERFISARKEND